MSSEPVDYECLPQREPRAKRKRVEKAPRASKAAEAEAAAPLPAGGPATEPSNGGKEATVRAENAALEAEEVAEYRASAVPGQKFEYLDHTADVQLHAWGETLQEAFENVGLCMFNYMTPLEDISAEGPSSETRIFEVEKNCDDLPSLLFHWLDELLFLFSTDFFVPKTLNITEFDREDWRITAEARGELFDRKRHVSGTEIKAITYSAMQINEKEGDAEIFAIVDI